MECNLCGTEYEGQCPDCAVVACSNLTLFKWVKKVAEYTVRLAVWHAGEEMYRHAKHHKHERIPHYTNP